LLLHGTGGNEDDLLTIGQMLDPKASILAPRGKVLENGMPRFFRRISPGVFDVEDLKSRANELMEFIHLACTKHRIDPRSLVAVGYSNGANIAAGLILLKPNFLKRLILFRAMLPLVPDRGLELVGTNVFISGGKYDEMIPEESTLELKSVLQKSGASVKINWEQSTHALTVDEINKAREWLLSGKSQVTGF
jgi:phospholipase/carboxylesterase